MCILNISMILRIKAGADIIVAYMYNNDIIDKIQIPTNVLINAHNLLGLINFLKYYKND